jgi:outer membrane lipase/esterase
VRGQAAAAGAPTTLTSLPSDGMMALGAKERAHPGLGAAGPTGPFTAYVMGTFLGGSSADAPNLAGFSYGATSGVAGLEYSASRNLILGLAAGYTATNADLNTGATLDAGAIQVAAYLSFATKQVFLDALAAYGSVDLDLARPGLASDLVRGSTGASVYALAVRGGYLFDLGRLRAGPIAGLSYTHARIGGYTETGDAQLTMQVGAQTIDSLTGSAGLRFLAPFQAGGSLFVPYLNVTLEHQLGGGTQALAAGFTQAPGSPVTLSFPAFDARDYGKVEGGLTIELAPETSVNLSGASTFGRDDARDFRIGAGLNYRF